jgi:hypothetical protein
MSTRPNCSIPRSKIADLRHDLAAGLFDLARGFLQILFGGTRVRRRRRLRAQVETNDVGTLACEGQGVRASLTARDTGDKRDFAVKLSHLVLQAY